MKPAEETWAEEIQVSFGKAHSRFDEDYAVCKTWWDSSVCTKLYLILSLVREKTLGKQNYRYNFSFSSREQAINRKLISPSFSFPSPNFTSIIHRFRGIHWARWIWSGIMDNKAKQMKLYCYRVLFSRKQVSYRSNCFQCFWSGKQFSTTMTLR